MIAAKHATGILILVQYNNFALTMASIGVTHSYSSRPFLCALACITFRYHFMMTKYINDTANKTHTNKIIKWFKLDPPRNSRNLIICIRLDREIQA